MMVSVSVSEVLVRVALAIVGASLVTSDTLIDAGFGSKVAVIWALRVKNEQLNM